MELETPSKRSSSITVNMRRGPTLGVTSSPSSKASIIGSGFILPSDTSARSRWSKRQPNPVHNFGGRSETNADPKPFVWTADPKRVLAAVKRGKQALETIHKPGD